VKPKQPAGPAMALGNLRELGVQRGGTEPLRPRGMHKRTYQRILGMLAYHGAIRKQGASYPRKYRPDQHRAHLWRQCRNRFAELGGWPVR
jgi:hypothetical protein